MRRLLFSSATAMMIFLSACNIPVQETTTSPEVATAAALTVQAALNEEPIPLFTPTVATDASNGATPTFSKPVMGVGDVVNCRKGPGTNYERVIQLLPNDQMDIIGFYPPNYWVVQSSSGPCWVSGEFATPMGSFAVVPTVTAPPTPEGNAPDGVSLQKWDIFCNFQTLQADITIQWSDKVDDETGYRVVRNGSVVVELPANTTKYLETIPLTSGQSVTYSIVVFNAIGTASSSTITLSC